MKQKGTTTVDAILHRIIEESVTSVSRRRRQLHEEAAPGEQPTDSAASDEKQKMKKGDVQAKDIVEKLNTIRAGKSFKDKYVAAALEKYVSDMSAAERTALFAFLKGISQIVTGEIDAEAAVEPSDSPAHVEMKKSSGGGKPHVVKPQIVKDENAKTSKASSTEDSSGPVPIKPKEKKQ
jgi:hypothetical protein